MVKLNLNDLVTSLAVELMGVTTPTQHSTSERLLHQLVDYFGVDLSFLRRNDHDLGATILVAEWPPRPDIPDPDPLGTVLFREADPTFAATENLSSVLIVRPDSSDEYQDRVRQGSGVQGVSMAMVPLIIGETTMGVLGLIKFGDREWLSDELNALRAVAALLAQLHARVAAEERLRYLAYHDELTGLANRRALADHLALRLAPDNHGSVAVIFIDVDRLKALNSFLGHAAGDHYLKTLAQRLETISADTHLAARLGGDEFVVVLNGHADEERGLAFAEQLRQVANLAINIGGEEISRAVSLGLSIGTPGITSVSELMNQADQAMLQAKTRGGNEIKVFTAEMRQQNMIRTDIEIHLITAIRNGSMVLHYQPEVNILTNTITGIEALVRWPHPNLGLLPPAAFIDIIESTNLAGELGRWVLQTGCRQLTEWHAQFPGKPLGLSVNVSPAELITGDFVDSVQHILEVSGLDGRHLTLEITEQAIVRDTEQALTTLRALKKIGVKVSIDDFGTGYSSFAQLKSLPVDGLKIDRGFVAELGSNPDDLAIVRSIIGLAGSFDLRLVAEGVETEVAAATLIALGCTRAQGFLYSRPVPADQIAVLLRHGLQNTRARP